MNISDNYKILGAMIQDESITLTLQKKTGEVLSRAIESDNKWFSEAAEALRTGNSEKVIKIALDAYGVYSKAGVDYGSQTVLAEKNGFEIKLAQGAVLVNDEPMHNALTARMLRMYDQGFNINPLICFLEKLMSNPSNTAINELYMFLEANDLSITDDGDFLAYKSINENFTSIHDGKTSNKIGEVVSMPRNRVDDNRDRTCSNGLHFASLDYCKNHFVGDKIVALKINPSDVVSIPSDYNNQKGRACKYFVYAEVTDEVKVQNRDPLSEDAVVHTSPFLEEFEDVLENMGFAVKTWDNHKTLAQNLKDKAEKQLRDAKGRFVK
jgi:hypothetical protein